MKLIIRLIEEGLKYLAYRPINSDSILCEIQYTTVGDVIDYYQSNRFI